MPWKTGRRVDRGALYVDEVSLRVRRSKQWIHAYAGRDLTVKFWHRKGNQEAIEVIHIIPTLRRIHDRWSPYLPYDHGDHGLCGSHRLRELSLVIEGNGYRWAYNMKWLLGETCAEVSAPEEKQLTDQGLANLH